MSLSDEQLYACIHKLGDSNGKSCNRVHYKDGFQQGVCKGRAEVENGRIKLFNLCNEPCEFLLAVHKLNQTVLRLQAYEKVITEVKERL